MFLKTLATALVLSLLAAVAAAETASDSAQAPAKAGFTDVTVESGVADMVAKHYKYMGPVLEAQKSEQKEWWLSGFTLIDMTGSGHLDLHLAGHGHPAIAAANDGKGKFTAIDPQWDIPRGKNKKNDNPLPGGEIRLAMDLNEDGKPDLLISYGDNAGVTYLNDCKAGNPPTWNFKVIDAGFDAFSRGAAFADLNRDGIIDYMLTADEGRRLPADPLHIFLGKGDVKWEAGGPDVKVVKEAGAIAVDINGDGFVDLLSSQRGYNSAARLILLNDGKGNFKDATKDCGLDASGSIMGVGDVNQDGFIDLICFDQIDKALKFAFYINDGKGHFTRSEEEIVGFEKAPKPSSSNWGGAVVVDLDNDGIPDVIVNGRDFLYVLHGLGGGKFEYVNDKWGGFPRGFHPNVDEGLCFGDFTGDGMLDFVTYGHGAGLEGRKVAMLRNDLPKKNWLAVQLVGKKGMRSAGNAVIRVYEAGGLGDAKKLVAYEQVCIWGRQSFHSYYTAANTERHFGLGDRAKVDVSVEFYPSGKQVEKKGVAANRIALITEEAGTVEEKELK